MTSRLVNLFSFPGTQTALSWLNQLASPLVIFFKTLVQEAICSSLEDYNKQIEQLKEEMNDATRGADNIRNDISALTQRYAVIDREEECGVCLPKLNSIM